ncbi:MAG: hypothetical protein E7327_07420 [Clostridiales bacterium]|nr:hypothetical protein [Clostridiales bacterium]
MRRCGGADEKRAADEGPEASAGVGAAAVPAAADRSGGGDGAAAVAAERQARFPDRHADVRGRCGLRDRHGVYFHEAAGDAGLPLQQPRPGISSGGGWMPAVFSVSGKV